MRVTKGQTTIFSLRAYTGVGAPSSEGGTGGLVESGRSRMSFKTRSLSDRRGNCMGMITLSIAQQPQVKENIPDPSQTSH
ncbi:hypothetical protein CY34DRAFT_10227 [Suillus luteus UH-Slu-Lm8-n1]|uniref:Uncharacterized protein n=1 Tax=Suillus luteus UH-Slu-Lm8-n1 TaxID=930992 RepID=A0A0D0BRM4_9AGAM|nr:hypothetical protein CY34DRAFT_10227 [Suillus luteus UH-Slu-Lm8-n1]